MTECAVLDCEMASFDGREFCWTVRVYIEDTDAGGIVYYVNYLKYMERARTEMLRALGQGRMALSDEQCMFVVRSARVDYSVPARLDDLLQVRTSLVALRGAGLTLCQRIFHIGDDSHVPRMLCEGEVMLALVDRVSLRPRRIPPAMKEGFTMLADMAMKSSGAVGCALQGGPNTHGDRSGK